MPLTKTDWEAAQFSQTACNLSGLVHSLSELIPRIREEPDFNGTEYVNTHPIVKMFVLQMCHLAFKGSLPECDYPAMDKAVNEAIERLTVISNQPENNANVI